jgi:ribosomal protein S18 acetylase RimI-like enzyme
MLVEIIHLQPNQWQQYRQIRLEALQDSPQAFSTTFKEMVDKPELFWQERLANAADGKSSWLLFAKVEERIAGIIGAFLAEDNGKAVIVSVYVTPEYRSKGVSNALLDAILGELWQNVTVHTLELAVVKSQKAAISLYKRFGFKIIGEKEVEMGDEKVNFEYVMQRIIRIPKENE